MTVTVSRFEDDPAEWNRLVERSPQGSVFHHRSFLEAVERNSEGTLHSLVGYKGEEPIGLFPVIEIRKFGVSTVFSPPPNFGIHYQGPVMLNLVKLKQRKRERRVRRFLEGCLEWVDRQLGPDYVRVKTRPGYDDPRPFCWNGFSVRPKFTYELDVSRDPAEIKRSFSKSLRRYLDPDEPERYQIERRGADGIEIIHEHMTSRFEAQGETYSIPLDFLLDLYRELPDGRVRPYIGIVDDEFASGILVLEDSDTVYFKEGGGTPRVEFPINDLLHWEIITDAHERGLSTYDLYDANIERLCDYKSKFDPALSRYYVLERSTPIMKAVSTAYRWINQ